jgi:hypothetical protein
MATLPTDELNIIAEFGPHRAYLGGRRLDAAVEADRLVKTHSRGRDWGCPQAPARIRTCGTTAYGSYFGCLA